MIRTETDELEGSADPHRAPGRRVEARNQWQFKWLRGNDDAGSVFLKRKSFSGDAQMNKDNFEGGVRSAVGQGEKFVGSATDDKASEIKGAYNEVAGSAQSAWGSAKDAAKEMADSGSIPDMSRLREDIAKLTQTVSDLAQKQIASSRGQVAGVVGAAGDSLSQSATVAQDKFAAVEGDVEARIKKNPWGAVAVAGLIGLLIGKMS